MDPRDEHLEFHKPVSNEEYEKFRTENPFIGKFMPMENVPIVGNFNPNDEKFKVNISDDLFR